MLLIKTTSANRYGPTFLSLWNYFDLTTHHWKSDLPAQFNISLTFIHTKSALQTGHMPNYTYTPIWSARMHDSLQLSHLTGTADEMGTKARGRDGGEDVRTLSRLRSHCSFSKSPAAVWGIRAWWPGIAVTSIHRHTYYKLHLYNSSNSFIRSFIRVWVRTMIMIGEITATHAHESSHLMINFCWNTKFKLSFDFVMISWRLTWSR